MFSRILFALFVAFPFLMQAGSAVQPLNVKLGLWETTMTTTMAGIPTIPDSALAQMTPDQRAKVEAMMGGKPTTMKSCVTKEKLDKAMAFQNMPKSCTYTVVTSTSSKLEMHLECAQNGVKSTGAIVVEASDSEHTKGSMRVNAGANGANTNMNSTFTSKWLGADCGSVQ
jgi:hypothetical protein